MIFRIAKGYVTKVEHKFCKGNTGVEETNYRIRKGNIKVAIAFTIKKSGIDIHFN